MSKRDSYEVDTMQYSNNGETAGIKAYVSRKKLGQTPRT
jgi:hypothetical protein